MYDMTILPHKEKLFNNLLSYFHNGNSVHMAFVFESCFSAFEAELLLVALAGVLALVAARRSLAHARAAAAAHALGALARSRSVGETGKIHCRFPFFV